MKKTVSRRQKQLLAVAGITAGALIAVLAVALVLLLRPAAGPGGDPVQRPGMGLGEVLGTKLGGDPAQALNGWASVTDFGAVPDDGGDDTAAFEAAAKSGYSVFIPAGEYHLERPIALNGQGLRGCGARITRVISRCTDPAQPIFRVGGTATVRDLSMGYDPALITGSEGEGERIALQMGAKIPAAAGSRVANLGFTHVGTAVRIGGDGPSCDNTAFEELRIEAFSFRGVEIIGENSGNVFRGVWLENSGADADCAVWVDGEDSAVVLDRVIAVGCTLKNGISASAESGAFIRGTLFENGSIAGGGKS